MFQICDRHTKKSKVNTKCSLQHFPKNILKKKIFCGGRYKNVTFWKLCGHPITCGVRVTQHSEKQSYLQSNMVVLWLPVDLDDLP